MAFIRDLFIGIISSIITTFLASLFVHISQYMQVAVCIIVFLVFICAYILTKLVRLKNLCSSIVIEEHSYCYVLLETLQEFTKMNPHNNFTHKQMKWNFYLKENGNYVDLTAEVMTTFSSSLAIKSFELGISGGTDGENNLTVTSATQLSNGSALNLYPSKIRNQENYFTIKIPLRTHIIKGETGTVTVNYEWRKFLIQDIEDDYFYIFPISHCKKLNAMELNFEHPYICGLNCYRLRRRILTGYITIFITPENQSTNDVEVTGGVGLKHSVAIHNIDMSDVWIFIFHKT